MLTVSSSVEIYEQVHIEDDGMRTLDNRRAPIGWNIDYGDYYSNGDIGTLIATHISGGKHIAAINKYFPSLAYDADNFRYCIMKCSSLTADSITIGLVDGIDDVEKVNLTSSGYATLDIFGSGYSPDRIWIQIWGDVNEKAEIDYVIISNATTRRLYPTEIEINRILTEGFDDATFKYDYEEPLPLMNSHVKIWLRKNGSFTKQFTGKVKLNREIKTGKTATWHETECEGYGKYLFERKHTGFVKNEIDDVIDTITTSLKNLGLLTTYNVTESDHTISIKHEEGGRYVGDILREDIANPTQNRVDWDFYVDFGKDLHAFPKGSRLQSYNVGSNAMSFNYESDSERMINSISIIGKGPPEGKKIGSDNEYTESTDNWSGYISISALGGSARIKGDYYLRGEGNENSLWIERTFPTPLNLEYGGYLEGYKQITCYPSLSADIEDLDMSCIFYSTDSDYYTYSWLESGGFIVRLRPPNIYYPWLAWKSSDKLEKFQIPFTEKYGRGEFVATGNPDWSNIFKVRIIVNSPLSTTDKASYFSIDGMSFSTHYSYKYGDDESIGSFGIREGPDMIRRKLGSDELCSLASSLVVEAYKYPIENVTNLITTRSFEASLGCRVAFIIGDIFSTIDLRRINHTLRDFNLTTNLELSGRYLPSIEKLLGQFQMQMEHIFWNIEAWRKIFDVSAITKGRGELLDWWSLDEGVSAPMWGFGGKKFGMFGESKDGYSSSEYSPDGSVFFSSGRLLIKTRGGESNFLKSLHTIVPTDKDLIFCSVAEVTNDDTEVVVMLGITTWNGCGLGFIFSDDGTLYSYGNRCEQTGAMFPLTTFNYGQEYKLECRYYPNTPLAEFYVDNNLEGSITSTNYLPLEGLMHQILVNNYNAYGNWGTVIVSYFQGAIGY